MRLLTLFLTAGLVFAQDKPREDTQTAKTQTETPREPWVGEIIQVKTLNGDAFDRLMTLLSVFGANVKGDNQLRTILVYAPKDVVAQMRRVVEELDRPGSEAAIGRNIDMNLTLLRCSAKPAAAPEALPADIEPVARQLRATMQCKDIQLWEVLPMRVQEGKEATGNLRLPGSVEGQYYPAVRFNIHPEAVYRRDQGRFVRFARINLDFRIPVVTGHLGENKQFSFMDDSLHTSGDFMEGQKTVLGKVSGIAEEDTVFAVVTLKVLD